MQDESAGAPASDQSLGAPIRTFRARSTSRIVVATCGAILAGGGLFLIVRDFSEGITIYSIGWIPLPVGFLALALAYLMGQSSYLVCPGGVIRARLGYQLSCRWDDVSEMIDLHVKQGLVTSRIGVFVLRNGSRIEFSDLGIDDFAAMIDLLRQQAVSRGIPWKEEQTTK